MPARLAPIAFGFILSALMSFIVSGIATYHSAGLVDGFGSLWIWLPSWMIVFPVVLVVAPVTRRLIALIVRTPATNAG